VGGWVGGWVAVRVGFVVVTRPFLQWNAHTALHPSHLHPAPPSLQQPTKDAAAQSRRGALHAEILQLLQMLVTAQEGGADDGLLSMPVYPGVLGGQARWGVGGGVGLKGCVLQVQVLMQMRLQQASQGQQVTL